MRENPSSARDSIAWAGKSDFPGLTPETIDLFSDRLDVLTPAQRDWLKSEWSNENQRTARIFGTLVNRAATMKVGEVIADNRDTAVEEVVYQEKFGARFNQAKSHIAVLDAQLGAGFRADIDAEIAQATSGQADAETLDFIRSVWGNLAEPATLQRPEIAEFIAVRAAAKVYLSERGQQAIRERPELVEAARNLSRYRDVLGLTKSVPPYQVAQLVSDQPRATRERVIEMTHSLTSGHDKARVRRVGESLHIDRGEGGEGYEITLADPPELIKRRGALEARHNLRAAPSERVQQALAQKNRLEAGIDRSIGIIALQGKALAALPPAPAATTGQGEAIPELYKRADLERAISGLEIPLQADRFDPVDVENRMSPLRLQAQEGLRIAQAWFDGITNGLYPEDVAEEIKRRDILEPQVDALRRIEELADRVEQDARRHQALASTTDTPTDIGQDTQRFEAVADKNLQILTNLGLDRWDSSADIERLLRYAHERSRARGEAGFAMDGASGAIDLGVREIGTEARELVAILYGWTTRGGETAELPTQAQYEAVARDVRRWPDSAVLGHYRFIKAHNDGIFPSVARLRTMDEGQKTNYVQADIDEHRFQ